jgi:hypothetical protein
MCPAECDGPSTEHDRVRERCLAEEVCAATSVLCCPALCCVVLCCAVLFSRCNYDYSMGNQSSTCLYTIILLPSPICYTLLCAWQCAHLLLPCLSRCVLFNHCVAIPRNSISCSALCHPLFYLISSHYLLLLSRSVLRCTWKTWMTITRTFSRE